MTFAQSILALFSMILSFIWFIILIEVILSWLFAFGVLSMRGQFAGQIYQAVRTITNPILQPFRNLQYRLFPQLNTIDLSPLFALLAIWWLQNYFIGSFLMRVFA